MRTNTGLLLFVITTLFSTFPHTTARADGPPVTFDVIKPLNHLAANVIEGSDHVLYGTTYSGGTSYKGSVFKINRDGSGYAVIKSFNEADGSDVRAPVLEGLDGTLYGTTWAGGSGAKGTVFKVNKDGSGFTVLKNFSTSATAEGLSPAAGLVQAGNGALYGTTEGGGVGGQGTIFTLNTNGTSFAVLKTFMYADGGWPAAALVLGNDGILYGSTPRGGSSSDAGTIFKMNTNGADFTVLKRFLGSDYQGDYPSELIEGSDNALYGTTETGGPLGSSRGGTVFKINKNGSGFTTLKVFGDTGDGRLPFAKVVQGSDAALYGTTYTGGTNDSGTVYKINTDGTGYVMLHSFTGGTDGSGIRTSVIQGSDGMIYGTSSNGGGGGLFRINGPVAAVQKTFVARDPLTDAVTFSLDATASLPPPGSTLTGYKWDFDASDGLNFATPDATGVTTSQPFPLGTHTVTLQVTAANGSTDIVESVVEVIGPWSISGTITSEGVPLASVTVTPAPAGTPVTTDSSGNYTITGLGHGSYTVTPSKPCFTFTPAAESVTVGPNQTDVNFAATAVPIDEGFETGDLTAWLWVTGGDAGWTVDSTTQHGGTYSAKAGAITDNQHTYLEITLTGEAGYVSFFWQGYTEVWHDYFRFSIDGNVQNQWSGSNSWNTGGSYLVAAGTHTYRWEYIKDAGGSYSDAVWIDDIIFPPGAMFSISGMITHEGVGLAGVTVTPSPSGIPVTTDESGQYTITGLHPGYYTVTPTKAEYRFTPSAWTVPVDSDLTYVHFEAEAVTYSISGTITQDGIGVAGVTVTPTPTGSQVITDENGIYTITGLAAGTYTIIPAKSGLRFTPASQSVTVGPDQYTSDFTARTAVDLAFSNFGDTTGLTINGNAAVASTGDGDVLRLVPAVWWQSGSFFTTEQVDAATFSAFFKFRMTNPGGSSDETDTGGNGLAFVIQPVTTNAGGDADGPGYAWINPSIAMEFDTFQNAEHNDPNSNHLGINLNGDVNHGEGSPFTADVSPRFDDGNVWYAWVDYDGTNMEVRANQTGLRPATPTLSRELDLAGILGQTAAYVGFTAATSDAWGDHDIQAFQYRNCYEPIDSTDVTIASTDVPKTIPAAATMTSTTSISGVTGKIVDVNVTLSLDFSYNSCLGLTLISPWGTRVNLINAWELYGEAGFVHTTLDDEAGVPIGEGSPPYTGSYIPATPLSVLDGEDVNGDWVLEIVNASGDYSGTLNSWSLNITSILPDPRAPVITQQAESQTGVYSFPVSFTVAATGDETLFYQWRKDGVDLSDSEDGHYSGTQTATLNLAWVDYSSDPGNYTCVVSNAFGKASSIAATLSGVWHVYCNVSPPSVSVGTPGKPATFTAFVSEGVPPYTYLWSTGDTTPSITANAPGTFTCTVTDAANYQYSNSARYTISQTLPDSGTPQTDNSVNALAVQADGKIIVGGWFNQIGGVARQRLARLNADGSVDSTFIPVASGGQVVSVAIQPDGKILVGGLFCELAGQTRNYFGRLNSDGTLDESFDPAPNNIVYGIALQSDGKILIAGGFSNIGGVARSNVARLEVDGSLDATFTNGTNDHVRDILVQADDKILVGGYFTELAGQPCSYLGRLNPDGSLDSSFAPASTGYVFCLRRQPDGKLLVGGSFYYFGGHSRANLARLNADDTLDLTFDPSPNYYIGCLTVQADGKILAGGGFTSLGGQPREYLGRLNADGSLDTDFDVGADANVQCFAEVNGTIWVGGEFSRIGGEAHYGLSRLISTSTSPYAAWKASHFTPDELLDPNISGDMADPMHDGFANLLKYATGSSPDLSDGLARSDARVSGTPAALTFKFHRNTDALDVILHVLVSDSLSPTSWSITATCTNGVWSGPATVSEVGTENPIHVEVLDTLPVTAAKRRFMRLEIIKP
jgi:uncharacterized delta-60 repeat protein